MGIIAVERRVERSVECTTNRLLDGYDTIALIVKKKVSSVQVHQAKV